MGGRLYQARHSTLQEVQHSPVEGFRLHEREGAIQPVGGVVPHQRGHTVWVEAIEFCAIVPPIAEARRRAG